MSEDSSKIPDKQVAPNGWGPFVGVLYGFGVALLGVQIAVGVLIGLILGFLGMGSTEIGQWTGTVHGQFMFTAAAEIMMFSAIYFFLRSKQINLAAIGLNRFRSKYLLYVLLGTVAYFLTYLIVVSVVATVLPSLNLEQKQDVGFNNPVGITQMAMVFISLVILPPIAEETVFRGFMFTGLRSKLTFATTAVITSIFFAIGHLQIGQGTPLLWVAGIDTFILSMVLCYIREKTGSIWPTIGIHMVKNFIAFSFLYLIP
jgi:membrane protease YdiL (CAAX protease family)